METTSEMNLKARVPQTAQQLTNPGSRLPSAEQYLHRFDFRGCYSNYTHKVPRRYFIAGRSPSDPASNSTIMANQPPTDFENLFGSMSSASPPLRPSSEFRLTNISRPCEMSLSLHTLLCSRPRSHDHLCLHILSIISKPIQTYQRHHSYPQNDSVH